RVRPAGRLGSETERGTFHTPGEIRRCTAGSNRPWRLGRAVREGASKVIQDAPQHPRALRAREGVVAAVPPEELAPLARRFSEGELRGPREDLVVEPVADQDRSRRDPADPILDRIRVQGIQLAPVERSLT